MNVSVTRTFHEKNEGNKGFRQQRAYDYLYDPTFTVSGEIDHTRLSHKALSSVDRVRKYPEFNSMFSNLPHHPHYTLRLDATDPVPNFIDRRWRGLSEQRRETLQKLSGHAYPNCFTYAHHLFVSGLAFYSWIKLDHPDSPFQRTVGVQTDYRDSEAQTEPYSPEYTLHPGTAPPELLTLASLMWGRGLPAGLEEVEMIERARKKRAWETTLPPLNDLNQLEQRKRMMDEMERKEWAFREQEIEKLQEARLDLLMQLLQQREVQQEEATVGQLDEYFAQRQRQKEDRLHKIRSDYVLSVRKLLAKRRAVDVKRGKRDVISEHSDYGSQTYAPLSRHGVFPDRHTARSTVTSRLLSTYQGLLELETSLPASALEPRIKAPKPRASKGFLSRSERREMELMRMHQALKDTKVRAEEKKPLRFLYKKEKPVPRPSTPVVDVPLESEEKKELAVIYLQKLLRGRSIQNQMLEGRAKRLELIQELRTTHALQREEQELQRADKQVTLALQRERELHSTKISQIDAYMAGLSGAVLVDMLDFLAKELVRLQEERRIHAFTLLAERDRRIREAEESGRRQVEERRRREEDEIFKQVVKVHQATVDLYLEDVIIRTIEHTAEDQAREEIHHMAQELDAIAHAMEQPRDSVQSEEIVAELVYRFLIPEVHKITVRDRGTSCIPHVLFKLFKVLYEIFNLIQTYLYKTFLQLVLSPSNLTKIRKDLQNHTESIRSNTKGVARAA
uniref:Cilia- and flagella-associated protein 91 n=1 Tax=Electrophorus electricus TaxID=8005 RepID=A0A4W4GXM3_ELEEL